MAKGKGNIANFGGKKAPHFKKGGGRVKAVKPAKKGK